MLEQVSNSVKFLAFYTASKQGKTGLTVTIDIYDPSGTQIVTGASATALGGGLYSYTLSSNNSSEGEYAAIFKTTDSTVDSQHIPSLWVLGRAGVENLDATTSSRLPSSSYTAAPTVSAIRTELDTNSTKLANLDASVSSRLAAADYTAPTAAPTAAAVASAVRSELTEISNLDASVSSRLASASYTAPANSDISAIKAKTDNLPASPAAVSDIPTAAQISAAVEGSLLDENDGQTVLNAIVGAIGNSNVDEVALVAAIRSDLERSGGKLDSIPTDAAPSAASVASAVWSASTKEITGGTVDTLTNSPDVPTESEIAAQVRTELSVELGRIDQAISTRLASADYTAPSTPPTASAIADEVRVELTAELAKVSALNTERLANVATTAIVGNLIAQANS